MKLLDVLEDFWFYLKYKKQDVVIALTWAGIYIIGGMIIIYLETKEFWQKGRK